MLQKIKWILRVAKNNLIEASNATKLTIATGDAPIFTMTKIVYFDKPELRMPDFGMCKFLMSKGVDLTTCDSQDCNGVGTAQIAFSPKEQKWYGWSHRAIYGFGIGYIAKEGDCCTISGALPEYVEDNPNLDKSVAVGFEIKNMADAKRVAIAFADSVS